MPRRYVFPFSAFRIFVMFGARIPFLARRAEIQLCTSAGVHPAAPLAWIWSNLWAVRWGAIANQAREGFAQWTWPADGC